VNGRLGEFLRSAFSSLEVHNYRLYFFGQGISLVGTWMQTTAQSWLVYSLTHSATDLGLVVALQTLPVLVLAPYGGVVADRADKRNLMIILQSLMGVQALVLGILAVLGAVTFGEVCLLAVVLGLNNTFEFPARQAFVQEMVGRRQVRNAVTLNAVSNNAARAIGPAVAGVLIATVGDGICFLANAASFVAVVVSLAVMDTKALEKVPPVPRVRGQLSQGIAYAASVKEIAVPLFMMGLVGTLAYEFQVSLPALAGSTFHGGSEAYGFMTASMGAGAVGGGLWRAAKGKTGIRAMVVSSSLFGLAILASGLAPDLIASCVALVAVGWGSVSFISIGNSTLQLAAEPQMRGRVLALWQVAFQGTTPIGGPLVGWVISETDPRGGLVVGAASCLLAALGGGALAARMRSSQEVVPPRSGDRGAGDADEAVLAS